MYRYLINFWRFFLITAFLCSSIPLHPMQANRGASTTLIALGAAAVAGAVLVLSKIKLQKKPADNAKSDEIKARSCKIYYGLLQKYPGLSAETLAEKYEPRRTSLEALEVRLDLIRARQDRLLGFRNANQKSSYEIIEEAIYKNSVSLYDLPIKEIEHYMTDLTTLHMVPVQRDRAKKEQVEKFNQLITHGELHMPVLAYVLTRHNVDIDIPGVKFEEDSVLLTLGHEVFPFHNRRKQLIENSLQQLPRPLVNLVLGYANNEVELPTIT